MILMIKYFVVVAILCFLCGCAGYPRILTYPFDPGGRSLNSSASELDPQVTGKYIVFASDRQGSQDIYMFDRQGRNLIDLPGLNSFDAIADHPAVSQDGRYIVFAATRHGKQSIFLYDRETRQSRSLTDNLQAEFRHPTISADGNSIAFESSVNGQWDVVVYDRFGKQISIP